MTMAWSEVMDKMDAFGIPPLMACARGFKEPEIVFFDSATWQWMGRSAVNTGSYLKPDVQYVISRQLEDGRWITQRIATDDDNRKIDAAQSNSLRNRMDVIR